MFVAPYTLGDRVAIMNPGSLPEAGSLVVAEVSMLSTRFISWNGESVLISNYILRKMSVVNLSRSKAPLFSYRITLPAGTAPEQVTAFIDSVRAYASDSPDWISGSGAMCGAEYEKGALLVDVTLTSVYLRHEEGKIEDAVSRLWLFVHAYTLAAGLEFVKPVLPVLAVASDGLMVLGRGGGAGGAQGGRRPSPMGRERQAPGALPPPAVAPPSADEAEATAGAGAVASSGPRTHGSVSGRGFTGGPKAAMEMH